MLAKAEALISIFFRPVFWSMRYSNLEYTCATTLGSRSTHAGESCGGDMNELSGRTIAGRCPQLADRSGDNGGWRGYGPLAGGEGMLIFAWTVSYSTQDCGRLMGRLVSLKGVRCSFFG
ncbi:uncharacterized protein [Physcomitrium patens]|uniref:uncharacterized protein isoform X1 n=1 Tax=Physcomitrium patens TaxID=3218 RepID=UPI003CCE3224